MKPYPEKKLLWIRARCSCGKGLEGTAFTQKEITEILAAFREKHSGQGHKVQ